MRFAPFLLPLAVAACMRPDDLSRWVPENAAVTQARNVMVGMSRTDVLMCAGFPTEELEMPGSSTIWTYDLSRTRSNFNLSLPRVTTGPLQGGAGAVGMNAGAGSCSAQIRFEQQRVAQVEFSGDNNTLRSINGLCTPIIDGCVRYADRTRGTLGQHDPD